MNWIAMTAVFLFGPFITDDMPRLDDMPSLEKNPIRLMAEKEKDSKKFEDLQPSVAPPNLDKEKEKKKRDSSSRPSETTKEKGEYARFELAGPLRLEVQTGPSFINPEWRTSFNGNRREVDLEDFVVWDTRFSAWYPFFDFRLKLNFTIGAVVDGEVEHYNRQTTTRKWEAEASGVSLGAAAYLYRQLGLSWLFLRIGFSYSYYKFYADEPSESDAVTPGPHTPVQGLDSWYRQEWLEAKIGFYYYPQTIPNGVFFGIDFVPGVWFFGKGRDRHNDSRFEEGTSEIFGKGGYGFSGEVGYFIRFSRREQISFGFQWKYLKVTDGYFKRFSGGSETRTSMGAETGEFWLFVRYERSF